MDPSLLSQEQAFVIGYVLCWRKIHKHGIWLHYFEYWQAELNYFAQQLSSYKLWPMLPIVLNDSWTMELVYLWEEMYF